MRQDISQLVYQRLHPVLSNYGITLDTVEVQGLSLRDERIKINLSIPSLDYNELDRMYRHKNIMNSLINQQSKQQEEGLEQEQYMIWRKTLDRYADEIAALQAELESTRTDIGLRMDAQSARLQKLSQAISNDLRASAPPLEMIPLSKP